MCVRDVCTKCVCTRRVFSGIYVLDIYASACVNNARLLQTVQTRSALYSDTTLENHCTRHPTQSHDTDIGSISLSPCDNHFIRCPTGSILCCSTANHQPHSHLPTHKSITKSLQCTIFELNQFKHTHKKYIHP